MNDGRFNRKREITKCKKHGDRRCDFIFEELLFLTKKPSGDIRRREQDKDHVPFPIFYKLFQTYSPKPNQLRPSNVLWISYIPKVTRSTRILQDSLLGTYSWRPNINIKVFLITFIEILNN